MKPMLKAPMTKYLKLEYDGLVSSFAFKFNLRRYNMAVARATLGAHGRIQRAHIRYLVGRCRLTLSNPR